MGQQVNMQKTTQDLRMIGYNTALRTAAPKNSKNIPHPLAMSRSERRHGLPAGAVQCLELSLEWNPC